MLKGTKKNVYNFLAEVTSARERKNKYKVITELVQRLLPNAKEIPKEQLVEIVYYAVKYDRDLRHITQKYKDLRGTDYEDKTKLEKKALLEYNYRV